MVADGHQQSTKIFQKTKTKSSQKCPVETALDKRVCQGLRPSTSREWNEGFWVKERRLMITLTLEYRYEFSEFWGVWAKGLGY